MEPRLFSRGNGLTLEEGKVTAEMLQWSRGFSAAEMLILA